MHTNKTKNNNNNKKTSNICYSDFYVCSISDTIFKVTWKESTEDILSVMKMRTVQFSPTSN